MAKMWHIQCVTLELLWPLASEHTTPATYKQRHTPLNSVPTMEHLCSTSEEETAGVPEHA